MNIAFPIITGVILDKFKAQNNITGGYAAVFAICAGAYLVAFAIQHLLAPKFEMVHLKDAT